MLRVTSAAKSRLFTKLVDSKAAADEAWRFTPKKKGWKLRLDRQQPNDKTLVHEGRNVLLLDQDVLRTTTKLTLDVANLETKPRLTLRTVAGKSD